MATNTLPLNKFRLIATTLDSGSTIIYRENLDVASIVLSAQITNITGSTQPTSVKILKSGSVSNDEAITLVREALVPPNESLNPISGKIVLERYDGFLVTSAESGSLQVVLSVLENANN
jgi:hypothetical protein